MALTVGEVMTRDVETIEPDRTLTEMDRLLVARGISGVPVVEGDKLVGIVSQTDVIRVLLAEQKKAQQVSGFYSSPFPIPIPALERLAQDSREIADRMTLLRVREVMTPEPRVVAPSEPIERAARIMADEGYHRLPVVADKRLLGIVTSLDLVRLVGERGLADA